MYLGIDLGTSSVKVLLINRDQRVVASSNLPLDISRPQIGWSEQDPMDWIHAAQDAIDQLRQSNPAEISVLKGIGLSGQMQGATLVDSSGNPLRPCILWNDTRAHREAAELNADPHFRLATGNLVFPGFTAPKLVWVKRNEPEVFAAIAKVLLPKDFVRFWLTGDFLSDVNDSAGTSWLDMATRRWCPELLAATGLSVDQMPKLVKSTDRAGTLRSELAQRWGICGDGKITVAGGAGDNAAAAVGIGAVRPGSALLCLGTSGILLCPSDTLRPIPDRGVHTFCFLANSWFHSGVIMSATDSLNWLARVTDTTPAQLTAELGDDLIAPGSVVFLPYLSGERTPHNDAHIRASFVGLSHQTDRRAMTQAVLEGVAFAFRDSLEALQLTGTYLSRVIAVGGGSRCLYWLRSLATILNIPIDLPSDGGDFGSAFGAARFALIAAEQLDPMEICTAPKIGKCIKPNEEMREAYERSYHIYQKLYPALKDVMENQQR